MCGIAGIIQTSNGTQAIRIMTKALAHRGPDATGYWSNNICNLGHQRLSILDLSDAANQPMVSHNGRYVMVYNGEIYNFKEIASQLSISLNTTSDTEVILEAFSRWGDAFIERLNGMFAIAIWDKDEQTLHLFRDRMGIKPLYFYSDGHVMAFASEMKALTALPEIRKKLEIDSEALGHYFHTGFIPAPLSIYKKIRKFPQGHRARYRAGTPIEIEPYWTVDSHVNQKVISNERSATEQLEELLIDSVRSRMISDVPFGTFLSGGIDSSLVTAIAQSQQDTPLHTFSIGFKESRYNEMHYARQVSDYLKTNHHEFILSERDAMDLVPNLTDVYDEPFADSSAIPTMLVSKMAKQHVTVTLSGDGGDECFLGYNTYRWAARLNHPLAKLLKAPIGMALKIGNPRMRRASWLFDPNQSTDHPSHLFSQEQYLFNAQEVNGLINAGYNPVLFQNKHKYNRKLNAAEKQSLFDLRYYLPDDLLVKVDRASMHYGLETRTPLLDHRLVQFALNLDANLKIRGGDSKYLLKQVLYKYAPAPLFDRPKWGFSIPLVHWMRKEMNTYIEDLLHSEKINKILAQKTHEIPAVQKWRKGDDLYYNRVWQLVMLSQFLEKNDG